MSEHTRDASGISSTHICATTNPNHFFDLKRTECAWYGAWPFRRGERLPSAGQSQTRLCHPLRAPWDLHGGESSIQIQLSPPLTSAIPRAPVTLASPPAPQRPSHAPGAISMNWGTSQSLSVKLRVVVLSSTRPGCSFLISSVVSSLLGACWRLQSGRGQAESCHASLHCSQGPTRPARITQSSGGRPDLPPPAPPYRMLMRVGPPDTKTVGTMFPMSRVGTGGLTSS